MINRLLSTLRILGVALLAAVTVQMPSHAEELEGGRLRVALLNDINDFDPQSFLAVNFPLIKNFYDTLIEYDSDGNAIPSLATSWEVAADNASVTLVLRDDVSFQSGTPLTADAVAVTLEKAADPARGRNVYATMAIVEGWEVVDPHTITLTFNNPVPDRQITDLLQFISVIDPAGIDTLDRGPAGTGAFTLVEWVPGQRVVLAANPNYWREGQPILDAVEYTIFSDNDAAAAALESGAVDAIYGGGSRQALRLRDSGFQLIQGPGPLVQVFRINSTWPPFDNQTFRQAFNHLMDREGILRVGYGGLGQVTVLPWAPASPAADPSYNDLYPYDLDRARELLAQSGLTPEQMSGWRLVVNAGDQNAVTISQIVQSSLSQVGINIELDLKQGAEFTEAMLGGQFAAMFGGIGNVQKFPSRVATNSIYRTSGNPVLGDPHPHPDYVEAIARVNATFGSGDEVQAAYDHLNQVLVETAFAIPTNTYDIGLIVAAPNVGGFTGDIDNMFVARTIGFRP